MTRRRCSTCNPSPTSRRYAAVRGVRTLCLTLTSSVLAVVVAAALIAGWNVNGAMRAQETALRAVQASVTTLDKNVQKRLDDLTERVRYLERQAARDRSERPPGIVR